MTDTPTASLPNPTWMVGAGQMGGAILDGWRASGFDLSCVTVIRPSGQAVEGARTVTGVAEAGTSPKLVILAVKPQKLDEIAAQLRPHLSAKTVLVSVLAGASLESLRRRFPGVKAVVRAMPNLAVAVRRGVVALIGEKDDASVERDVATVFQPIGYAPWMIDEARFSAVGALAGAGPAYVARFIAAMAKSGEKLGLSPEMSQTVALETMFGTAWMASASGESMASIAQRVASPNGTTEAGLAVLDRDHVLDELIALTFEAAARRGEELAKEAEGASLADQAPLL